MEISKTIPIFKEPEFYEYVGSELDSISSQNDIHVQFSGNPYVDNAILIVSVLYQNYFNIEVDPRKLTLKHIIDVFRFSRGNLKNGKEFTQINFLCNSAIYMLFPNNPLIQTSFRKKSEKSGIEAPQGKNLPSIKQEHIYVYYLLSFLKSIGKENNLVYCSYCGRNEAYSFHVADSFIFNQLGKDAEKFNTGFAKLWYPLVGTIKGEAQAYHGYSEQPNICGLCLILVHFLPQGIGLIKGKLALYQTNDIEISLAFIKENVTKIIGSYSISPDNKIDIPGKGESYISFYNHLLEVLANWNAIKHLEKLDLTSSLMLWMFTNSNTDVELSIEELPKVLLINLSGFYNRWRNQLKKFLKSDEKKGGYNTFIDKMKEGSEYLGFYSNVESNLIDQEFYETFEKLVVKRSQEILMFYKAVSNQILDLYTRKEIDSILKSNDFLRKMQIITSSILKCIENNSITYNILLEWVFNEINNKGYKPFDFYLHDGANLNVTEIFTTNFKNDIWDLIQILSKNYLHRLSLKGGFTIHSFLSNLKNENFSSVMREVRELIGSTPGFTWKRYLDIKKQIQSIPGKKNISLLLFKASILLNLQKKDYEKSNFNKFAELEDISELESESLLSSGLLEAIYNYISYRTIIQGFSLERSVLDFKRQITDSGKSLNSFVSFLKNKEIELDDNEFIKSQSKSESYISGSVRNDFSWFMMKQQIVNFIEQLKLISNWDKQLKEKLMIRNENNI